MRMILTAHGSADPRSPAVTRAVADEIRNLRPDLEIQVAFCEQSEPNLRQVLEQPGAPAVVTPLLLANAYHARVDIPAVVASTPAGRRGEVLQAQPLGEDRRLVQLMRHRLAESGVDADDADTAVLVVAVGSSHTAANARTATVAAKLARPGGWAAVRVAYATAPHSVAEGIARLRQMGASRIALAPWFIAPGRITDRVAGVAADHGVAMAATLGAHHLLAQTVLERFDRAVAERLAA